MFPHDHGFPELLSWWGSDPDHPEDTTEMTMIMGDEEIHLDRSWFAYVPAGMIHMPKLVPGGRVTGRPVCHWTFGPGSYARDRDGKEVRDEHEEARKEHVTVPGKRENLRLFVLGGQQETVKRPDFMNDLDSRYVRPMAFIDETVIPDAELGCYVMYILPGGASADTRSIMNPHRVGHGTFLTLTAMNYDDITDLAAEVEFWIGGEKHRINKSFGVYIPPDIEHGPLLIRNVSKQLFLMMAYPIGEGIRKYPGR
jgi:hypothetical protein